MSSEKIVCSISNYIIKNIPDFDRLLRDTCMTKLTEYRSSNGSTFVKPDPVLVKKYLNEIDSIVSDDQLFKIQNFCKRHFLRVSLIHHTGNTVINGERKELNFEKDKDNFKLSAGKNTVTLKKTNYRLNNRIIDNVSKEIKVSILEPISSSDGIHVLDGKQIERVERPVKDNKKSVKTGGAGYTRLDIDDFIRHMYSDNYNNSSSHFITPYLQLMNSLYLYLRKHHPDLYKSLIKISDKSPEVNFYTIVQPYNNNINTQLLSDDIIRGWGGTMFEYNPITTMNALNDEACVIIQQDLNTLGSYSNIFNKNPTKSSFIKDYDNYARFVNHSKLDVDTLKWIDEFRILYSDKFMSASLTRNGLNLVNINFNDVIKNIVFASNGSNKKRESILIRGQMDKLEHISISESPKSNSFYYMIAKIVGVDYSINNQSENFDALFKMMGSNYTYLNVKVNNSVFTPIKFYDHVNAYDEEKASHFFNGVQWINTFLSQNAQFMTVSGGKKQSKQKKSTPKNIKRNYNDEIEYIDEDNDDYMNNDKIDDYSNKRNKIDDDYNLDNLDNLDNDDNLDNLENDDNSDKNTPFGGISAI